jgi:AcrR family transcriptional regulator
MFTDMAKRSYTLRKRAESQEATRMRIVEALMQLHEELGPKNATISAIAERAGVQRLTVYRHFPDELALFQACTSRWLEINPPPDPFDWEGIADGAERCRLTLGALYAYYRSTERMWTVSLRDEEEVPALQGPMRVFRDYLDAIGAGILAGLDVPGDRRREVAATVAHALQFSTWASLAGQGLDDEEAALLATRWVACEAEIGRGGRNRVP